MLRLTSALVLLCWYANVCPSVGNPVGTRCTMKGGTPTCVCKTPNGTIDLTKIANFDGSRRYVKTRW